MTKATRVQLKLQDSGSILYKDSEDDIIFHIEAGDGSYGDGAEAATTDVMSFLRQHLLKNGASRHDVTSLMRTNRTIGPCSRPLWGCTTLGVLVSLLLQREKALKVAADVVAKMDKEEE